jgi:chaperone BCS1
MTILEIAAISAITVTLWAVFNSMLNAFIASLPARLWKWFVANITASIVIDKEDPVFGLFGEWVIKQPFAKKARTTRLVYSKIDKKYILSPGYGRYFFQYNGRYGIIIHAMKEEETPNSKRVTTSEHYKITMLGRNSHPTLKALIEETEQLREKDVSRQYIMNWNGNYWSYLPSKRKRSMTTVYIDPKINKEVVGHIEWFMKNEEWYIIRGIPYRLGILLEGPPGTGKTTYATALAGLFDKPICIANLSSLGSDNAIMNAFASAPHNAIILLEDVDTFPVANARVETAAPNSNVQALAGILQAAEKSTAEAINPMTLAGLLNAIDGVSASEGRILIMTSNYPEKLDKALVRSGRVDRRVHIGWLPPEEVERMFVTFFPERINQSKQIFRCAINLEKPCAWWQEQFIKFQNKPESLYEELNYAAGIHGPFMNTEII